MTELVCVLLMAAAIETPRAAMSQTAAAPTIDGIVHDAEWDTALPITGFRQLNSVQPPSNRQKAWMTYDKQRLYVAFRSWGEDPAQLVGDPKPRDGSLWQEDAFELLLADAEGKTRWQFIGNCRGNLFDGRNEDAAWDTEWDYRASITADGWMGEVAVTWMALGLDGPPATLGVNVAHDNVLPEGGEVSSWAAVSTHFHDPKSYAALRLVGRSFAAALDEITVKDREPKARLKLINTGDSDVSLHCVLEMENIDPAMTQAATCAAGTTKVITFAPRMRLKDTIKAALRVKAPDGSDLLAQPFPVASLQRVRASLLNLSPVGFANLSVVGPGGHAGNARWELRNSSDQAVRDGAIDLPKGRGEQRIDVADLADGAYTLAMTAVFPKAGVSEQRTIEFTRASKPPWLGTDAGRTTQPLPPYKPVTVRGGDLQCWGRRYEFDDRCLPSQIISQDHGLLASPVRLLATVEGKEHDLAAVPHQIKTQQANRVETVADGQVNGLHVKTDSWMEEDGFWWTTITLDSEQHADIDRLVLEIPLRREVARYLSTLDGTWRTYAFTLPHTGWRGRFWPVMVFADDDRSLAWYCESAQGWRPAGDEPMAVTVTTDAAVLRCELIGKRTALKDGLTWSFGLQAGPAKSIPQDWHNRRLVHGARYGMEKPGGPTSGRVEYPAAGHIDFAQGTFEAWIYNDFEADVVPESHATRGIHNNSFLQIRDDRDMLVSLYWNIGDRGWRYLSRHESKYDKATAIRRKPWKQRGWRHVALTWGDRVRFYDDGELVGAVDARGIWNGRTLDLDNVRVMLGTWHGYSSSRFRIRELRISNRTLATEEMLLDPAAARKRDDTLLYESFADDAPSTGKLVGVARITTRDDDTALALSSTKSSSRLDNLRQQGAKTIVYHQRWTLNYGTPYTTEYADNLEQLVKAFHERDMRLLLYQGYGLGDMADDLNGYHDYWVKRPIVRWVSGDGDPRQAFSMTCNACDYWTDYLLDHLDKSLDKHDFDGFYYDGTLSFRGCTNTHHGCGFVDETGALRKTYPLLATRALSKRLYALCKTRRETNLVDCHTSGNVLPMRAAWVDQLWNGEQFQNHQPGFHFPMDYFRAQCVGTQYGAPSMYLSYHQRPFVEAEAYSFTLLHNVLVRLSSNGTFKLWRIQDAFDVHTAQWHPYWRSAEYVQVESDPAGKVWDEGGLVSLHLHPGKRALLVVSNIQDAAASVTVRPSLEAMGLPETATARDAECEQELPIENSGIQLQLNGYEYRLIWIE